jgi:hypothetical protein
MSIYSFEMVNIWNYGILGHPQVPPRHSVQAERDTESSPALAGLSASVCGGIL